MNEGKKGILARAAALAARPELAAVLIAVLAACIAAGTLAGSRDLFASPWFLGLLGLLGLSSLLCLLLRYRPGRGAGQLLIHLSVIVVLTGAGMKALLKEAGFLSLREGEATSEMAVMQDGKMTQDARKLPFTVRLDRFRVELHEAGLDILVFKHQEDEPPAVIPAVPGTAATVDGLAITVLSLQEPPFIPVPGHPPVNRTTAGIRIDGEDTDLVEGRPVRRGSLALVLHQRQGEPRDFQSTLTILDENGDDVLTRSVVVNDPLVYRGWWLYQSDWDPADPSYSGILAVKDPGLYVTVAGLLILAVGSLLQIRLRRAAARQVSP